MDMYIYDAVRTPRGKSKASGGLDLVPGAVIDDHYTGKKRRERLLGVLEARRSLVGIGVDAGTATGVDDPYLCVRAHYTPAPHLWDSTLKPHWDGVGRPPFACLFVLLDRGEDPQSWVARHLFHI